MLLVVLLAGYGYLTLTGYSAQPIVQTANPASTSCISLGGEHQVRRDASGAEEGFCALPDGRVCEEWALFQRSECVTP